MKSDRIVFGIAEREEEKKDCFKLRHDVFVLEQRMFEHTDLDEYDKDSIHIYAAINGEIVGTVRITRLHEDLWLGSRLAVKKGLRKGLGGLLVKEAEKQVRRHGGTILQAFVQEKTERYFLRRGWKTLRDAGMMGIPHKLMEVRFEPGKDP